MPIKSVGMDEEQESAANQQSFESKHTIIPPSGDLIGDLLDIGFTNPTTYNAPISATQPVLASAGIDLLGDGLDSLVGFLF
jgi:hypothetical protein